MRKPFKRLGSRGRGPDRAKDDLDVVGSAEVEVVDDQRREEAAGMAGCVEHAGESTGGTNSPRPR
ncbi:hypothetical protein ACFP2T_31415 [Plantactinospora solaniradicis]|uniref:Uncharacterized protein n=1 Tax=Plantactinospora solaniradicis TaxID=1723736 RepID=A0ABW1KG48_9ACTN